MRVALVGCASAKLKRPELARNLYVSPLFKKASAYAEATCDEWYILSAKHGLLHPNDFIEPYDMKLGTRSGPVIHTWAAIVQEQLAAAVKDIEHLQLVALCGEQYRLPLYRGSWPYEAPMQGLGIGQQLAFLTNELKRMEISA